MVLRTTFIESWTLNKIFILCTFYLEGQVSRQVCSSSSCGGGALLPASTHLNLWTEKDTCRRKRGKGPTFSSHLPPLSSPAFVLTPGLSCSLLNHEEKISKGLQKQILYNTMHQSKIVRWWHPHPHIHPSVRPSVHTKILGIRFWGDARTPTRHARARVLLLHHPHGEVVRAYGHIYSGTSTLLLLHKLFLQKWTKFSLEVWREKRGAWRMGAGLLWTLYGPFFFSPESRSEPRLIIFLLRFQLWPEGTSETNERKKMNGRKNVSVDKKGVGRWWPTMEPMS